MRPRSEFKTEMTKIEELADSSSDPVSHETFVEKTLSNIEKSSSSWDRDLFLVTISCYEDNCTVSGIYSFYRRIKFFDTKDLLDKEHNTAFMILIRRSDTTEEYLTALELVIDRHLEKKYKNKDQENILHLCVRYERHGIINYLKKKMGSIDEYYDKKMKDLLDKYPSMKKYFSSIYSAEKTPPDVKVNYNFKFNFSIENTSEAHLQFISDYVKQTMPGKHLKELVYYPQEQFRINFQAKYQSISLRNQSPAFVKLLWHGTQIENIDSIMKNNFNMAFVGKNMKCKGSYGEGIYFSEDGYYREENTLILSYVITGRQFNCGNLRRSSDNLPLYYGCSLQEGYDSHRGTINPSAEIVVFDNKQIVPSYVIKIEDDKSLSSQNRVAFFIWSSHKKVKEPILENEANNVEKGIVLN